MRLHSASFRYRLELIHVIRVIFIFKMINKIVNSISEAITSIQSGASVMVGGFGTAGIPNELIEGFIQILNDKDIRNLTIINNYKAGKIELELVPQGNLSERIRAAGAGIGAFFTPTGYGTELAKHSDGTPKETREINGRMYVLEYPIHADFALIKAYKGDRWGNLTYRKSARNFGPSMAMAAKCTVASVYEILDLGDLDPESIVTPGIFVNKIILVPEPSHKVP